MSERERQRICAQLFRRNLPRKHSRIFRPVRLSLSLSLLLVSPSLARHRTQVILACIRVLCRRTSLSAFVPRRSFGADMSTDTSHTTTSPDTVTSDSPTTSNPPPSQPLVMQIVVRRDLLQVCHDSLHQRQSSLLTLTCNLLL